MRPIPLTVLKGGIQRLRTKGGASGQSLYDLVNAYITQDGSVAPRGGTIRDAALSSSTVGLCAIEGVNHVFATALQSVPSGYACDVLAHPSDSARTLAKIWFSQPFMGFPYVVAEFDNGDIFDYWLQQSGSWAADTVYQTGTIIVPTTPNGLAYLAVRDLPANPTWAPLTAVALNDIIEPTVPNGYAFKAIAVAGTSPHTGSSEPAWPSSEGAQVQEFSDASGSSSSTDQSGSTALSSAITDRYGDSAEIAGQTGTPSNSTGASVAASTAVTTWAPGTLYLPGAVVRPSTSQGAFINAIPNGDFEAGDDGNWSLSAGVTIQATNAYQGSKCLKFVLDHATGTATMSTFGAVTPGQSVSASAYLNPNSNGADMTMWLVLNWYDASDVFLSSTPATQTTGNGEEGFGYRKVTVSGVAPSGAVRCRVQVKSSTGTSGVNPSYADLVSWDLEQPVAVSNFLFEAVQADPGTSASSEPAWPTSEGGTVVDGGVTWQAIGTSIITWQAIPIMKSGDSEPVFPTTPGLTVLDGNMSWECTSRVVADPKCPHSTARALGASHVFAGDKDIVPFSAAVNPIDWSSANNAGYLPTGLNNYGNNPVAALGLYRSNLVAFNAGGYQMWQIDPDPQNMALLDAQPVGSVWQRALQAAANDLLFLTAAGVRNLAAAGPAASMQAGSLGQPIDPLVKARLKLATYEPIGLCYPPAGQYWLIFGPEAFVLTVNGAGKSWSRYVFPDAITDWTLNAETLYLRSAGNLIWKLDEATLVDDSGGANTGFTGTLQWPYLDCGAIGLEKSLIGVDLVGSGDVSIQIGWNENDATSFSDDAGFATSSSVTAPYEVASADTLPGTPIPIPVTAPSFSLILKFAANQAWSFKAANLYIDDSGGSTG